jgi:hypothetical protein
MEAGKKIDVALKDNALELREGFEALLLMSTFLTNEDLFDHIREVQKEVKRECRKH